MVFVLKMSCFKKNSAPLGAQAPVSIIFQHAQLGGSPQMCTNEIICEAKKHRTNGIYIENAALFLKKSAPLGPRAPRIKGFFSMHD